MIESRIHVYIDMCARAHVYHSSTIVNAREYFLSITVGYVSSSVSVFFRIFSSFVQFSFGLISYWISPANTINVVNKSQKHDFFSHNKCSPISERICPQTHHKTSMGWVCCCGDTKQFSKICIWNWIKMQSYYILHSQ